MFVLSQLHAGAACTYPRPVDQKLKRKNLNQGDFDVVIIHRQYGLLAGEIKSVGCSSTERGSVPVSDDEVLNPLRKMLGIKKGKQGKKVGQLRKARDVLRHVMSDLSGKPRVRSTLMLPFLTSTQLRRVLGNNSDIKQALCQELDVDSRTVDPVDVCLCADQMDDNLALCRFWTHHLSGNGPDPAMTDSQYTEIVARFAGPATVIRIFCPTARSAVPTDLRTEAEFVGEVANRFGANVVEDKILSIVSLYPDQVTLEMTRKEKKSEFL
nr:hypothetical protein BaRGS_021384 [Batillaria attramentaria]